MKMHQRLRAAIVAAVIVVSLNGPALGQAALENLLDLGRLPYLK